VQTRLDEEFREFMHARWPAMVRLAYALTGDPGHAEDVAQAAFAKAYAAWPRVLRSGDPDAYVRRIVVNENRNRFRKRRVPEHLTGFPLERADAQACVEDRSALMAALRALGPRQRAVIVLRYWLDLSEAEAAAVLNCSVGTVKSQTSRALAALRKSAELMDGDLR
jgi:RNA polymerase sigma-70 factor (sigma-E family)